ncbi:MAG: hypothetical protein QME71_02665 [Dehalococcoidia bacterium]|nr:hypothetical protein [Dehalococcoidia bacterium]
MALLVVMAVVAGARPEPARADNHEDGGYTPNPDLPQADISVDSGPDGVTIYIAVSETSPGSSSDSSSSTGPDASGGWSCTADVMNIGNASREWFERESAFHPGEAPWVVRCDNGFFGIVWLSIDTQPADIEIVVIQGDSVDPATVAVELLDHVPVPGIIIGVNPATGLVAVPSWFWIEGYDGAPIVASDTLGGVTVEVEVAPTGYRWSFGDGATLDTASRGQPYPQESDIRHTYEQSSLSVGGSFAVTVEVSFSARYRVNGGPWQPLDPITRSFTGAYPVQQLQSILTGR